MTTFFTALAAGWLAASIVVGLVLGRLIRDAHHGHGDQQVAR